MKGDSKALAACRPITIQSSILKIVENIALDYYRKLIEEGKVKVLDVSQCGFQEARSTQINICRVIGIIQQAVREKTNSVAIFVDVKSAFDSVNHKLMLKTLRE